ncbi:MAG: GNAT family N-acetyltransferase [Solobacterium sp.]|nr:GNAT family N-acetyltransferase [Solobacterium sp.]
MLLTTHITPDFSGVEEVKQLYEGSFPETERIPWKRLWNLMPEGTMDGYYLNGKLTGMSYVYRFQDIAYLAYLAVVKEAQGNGYGTEILHLVKETCTDRRIVVDIEEVAAPELEQKQRRKDFYLNNGYESCQVFYRFFSVDYELLSINGIVTASDWHALVRTMWGPWGRLAKFR